MVLGIGSTTAPIGTHSRSLTKDTHHMALTTLTVNGVDITTSESLTAILAALAPKEQPITLAPKVPQVANDQWNDTGLTAAKPKAAEPKAPKAPKVPTDGKALWAAITLAVSQGDYVTARRLAAPKPDTFGVQCEAAIVRRDAKQITAPKVLQDVPKPKADTHPVLDKVVPEAAPKERRAAKRAAKAREAIVAPKVKAATLAIDLADGVQYTEGVDSIGRRKPTHKPDCACPPCGYRRAKVVAPETPKAAPKAPKAPVAPKVPADPTPALSASTAAAEQRECDRIVAEAQERASKMLDTLDIDGLTTNMKSFGLLEKRNLRLGRTNIAKAYDDAADSCHLALQMVREHLAAVA